MPTFPASAKRLVLQSVLAGVIAALALLLFIRIPVLAQWGDPQQPSPAPSAEPAPAQAGGGSSVPSCDLLTEADVRPILGASVTALPDVATCTYIAGDLSGRAVSLSKAAGLPDGASALEAGMTQLATALDGTLTTLDLGEEAYAVTADVLTQLSVRAGTGDLLVLVITASPEADAGVHTLTELAQTALDRL